MGALTEMTKSEFSLNGSAEVRSTATPKPALSVGFFPQELGGDALERSVGPLADLAPAQFPVPHRAPGYVRAKATGDYATSWTAQDEDELAELWAAGLTATEIGAQTGRTRGQICGKARRMELAARPQGQAAKPPVRPKSSPKRNPLIDVQDGQCVWPIDNPDGESYHFCGDPVSARIDGRKRPYCTAHAAIAFPPQKKRTP